MSMAIIAVSGTMSAYSSLDSPSSKKDMKTETDHDQEDRNKRQKEEEETARKRENDRLSQQSMNIAMGDITGSGIPGGFDLNITTPL